MGRVFAHVANVVSNVLAEVEDSPDDTNTLGHYMFHAFSTGLERESPGHPSPATWCENMAAPWAEKKENNQSPPKALEPQSETSGWLELHDEMKSGFAAIIA